VTRAVEGASVVDDDGVRDTGPGAVSKAVISLHSLGGGSSSRRRNHLPAAGISSLRRVCNMTRGPARKSCHAGRGGDALTQTFVRQVGLWDVLRAIICLLTPIRLGNYIG